MRQLFFIRLIISVFIFFIVAFGIKMVLAWTPPSTAPPNGNVAAPLNSGNTTQTKTGGLNVATTSGKFGIGTSNPGQNFTLQADNSTVGVGDSAGQFAVRGATSAAKRLVLGYHVGNNYGWIQAGEDGVAWRDLVLQLNGGNVGIGTASPGAKLEVSGGALRLAGDQGLQFGTAGTSFYKNQNSNVESTQAHWGNLIYLVDSDNNDTNRYFAVAKNATILSGATQLFRVEENGGAYITEVAAPGTPSAGQGVIYASGDSKLYFKNDGGTAYNLTAGGANGSVVYECAMPLGGGGGIGCTPFGSQGCDGGLSRSATCYYRDFMGNCVSKSCTQVGYLMPL